VVGACGKDVTEPEAVRSMVAGNSASLTRQSGSSFWNGRVVAFMNLRPNSANQAVCLDIPWGVASVNQDVNYFPCHFDRAQQFVLTAWDADTLGNVWVMIRPVNGSSVCLDMRGGTTNGGEHLQLFTCKTPNSVGSGNQTFKLPRAMGDEGVGTFISVVCPRAGSNLVLEAPLPMTTSSFVQQAAIAAAGSTSNQWWSIMDIQTGHFLRSANPVGQINRSC
jgi:hypothetical protein